MGFHFLKQYRYATNPLNVYVTNDYIFFCTITCSLLSMCNNFVNDIISWNKMFTNVVMFGQISTGPMYLIVHYSCHTETCILLLTPCNVICLLWNNTTVCIDYLFIAPYRLLCITVYLHMNVYTVTTYGCTQTEYKQNASWSQEWCLWLVTYIQICIYVHKRICACIWMSNMIIPHVTSPA